MFKRVMSGVLLTPLLIAVVWYGGIFIYLAAVIVSLISLHEFYQAFKKKGINPIRMVGYFVSILILTDFYYTKSSTYTIFLLVMAFILLSLTLLLKEKYNINDGAITLYGILYITVLIGHIILISRHDKSSFIWLVFITAWATDTFAYFSGKFFGKRKLCPTISPKKTIEGSIGGIIGCMLLSGLFGYFIIGQYIFLIVIVGLVGSILSQTGDLTASVIKRYVGIKDYGNLIPGHGGLMDRFDSILFTAPLIYYFIILITYLE